MIWLLLAVVACCPLLAGCGNGGTAEGTDNVEEAKIYQQHPTAPDPKVDSETSWKKFFAKFKSTLRKPTAAQEKWKEEHFAGKVKLVNMNADLEMEYIQYGDAVDIKGINPERVYEVGVISLAAKEEKGSEGFQIREYKLKFITPKQDGQWIFAEGLFKVSSSQGPNPYSGDGWALMNQEEFDKSYLKLLFYEPEAKAEGEE